MIVPRDGAGVRYARFGGAAGRRLAKSLALGLRVAPRRVLVMRAIQARAIPWRDGGGAAFGRILRSSRRAAFRCAGVRRDDALRVSGTGFAMRRARSFRGSLAEPVRHSGWSLEGLRTGRADADVRLGAAGPQRRLRGASAARIGRVVVSSKLTKTVPRDRAGGAAVIGPLRGPGVSLWGSARRAAGLPALVSARRPDDRVSGRRAVAAARSSRTIRQALALCHLMPRYRAALEGGGVVARAVAPVVRDRGAPLVDRDFDARRPADIDTSVRGDEHRRRPVSHAGVVERRFDGQAVGAVDTKGRVGDRLDRAAVVPEDMARMVRDLFTDEARRPPSGVTGFDSALSPIFPGRKPAF